MHTAVARYAQYTDFRATAASAMPMPTSIAAAATAHRVAVVVVAVVALPRSLTEIIKIACGIKQIENGSRDEANC